MGTQRDLDRPTAAGRLTLSPSHPRSGGAGRQTAVRGPSSRFSVLGSPMTYPDGWA